jgi:hypothetical protein
MVSVLYGNGDGTFKPAHSLVTGSVPVAVADVNGDGKPDLVVRSADQAVAVLLNSGGMISSGLDGIVGRAAQTGQWFVGVANGASGFTTSEGDAWNPAMTWADVQTGLADGPVVRGSVHGQQL